MHTFQPAWTTALVFSSLVIPLVSMQTIQSIRNPKGGNSCNVVNVHFEDSGSDRGDGSQQGPVGNPGKRGPLGPQGLKGNEGEKGEKGDKGEVADIRNLQHSVIESLSAENCTELRDVHGISKTGYYLMKGKHSFRNDVAYRYCDFKVYSGVSTCAELVAKYNISKYGYYQMGNGRDEFRYCPDVYTCYHLAERDGVEESGIYRLGQPQNSFEVFCNFFSGQAITEVRHDSMEEIEASACEQPGCYSRQPSYEIATDKILKIIEHSKNCRQFIKYRCQGSVLLNDLSVQHGYWISRNGEMMKYWGDTPSKRPGYCACGETGSCILANNKCNCDNNGSPMTQDEGYLTDKSKLPVREMKFGDLGDASEKGWHTLGKLECSGHA